MLGWDAEDVVIENKNDEVHYYRNIMDGTPNGKQ